MSVVQKDVTVSAQDRERSSYASYVVGFVSSLGCTLIAYTLVVHHALSKGAIVGLIAALALLQFVIQMVLFLHLGSEHKPRVKLLVFGFMVLVVLILVTGSIWIMYSLNYRMMTPDQINTYMLNQNGGI